MDKKPMSTGKLILLIVSLLILVWLIPVVLIIAYFMILSGIEYDYTLLQSRENIQSIVIISAEDYPYSSKNDVDLSTEIAIPQHEWDGFWEEFEQVPCRKFVNDPEPYLSGRTVFIIYLDGSCEYISAHGTMYFDQSTEKTNYTWYYFDTEEFSAFAARYDYTAP